MSMKRMLQHCFDSKSSPFMSAFPRSFAAFATLIFGIAAAAPLLAASSANANSPLGINVHFVNYYSSEQPFLDIFKTNGGFSTQTSSGSGTGEEQYLNLDANGWPISLTAVNEPKAQQFTQVSVLLLRALPQTPNGVYPAGQYVVRYQGQGTITYAFDAVKVSSAPGRDVLNVANPTSGGGIQITITSTDPNHTGNYIRNIQLVKAENESALLAGQMFSPTFLNLLRNFRTIRFMDWLNTNGSTQSSWAARPLVTNASWSTKAGVPYEAILQLANAVSADAWINVPAMADDNYMQQLATLVHSNLGSSQKAYVEYSNETWNTGFSQEAWITAQGQKTFSGLEDGLEYNRNWFGMRTAQMCDIWKSVWGADFSRVVCVLGAQAANTYTATDSLDCKAWTAGAPCSGHNINAVAIAPYFGGTVPALWALLPDGGLANFFASLTSQNDPLIPGGGWLGQALGWVSKYSAAMAKYKLPLISYEGGQTFESFPNGVNADGSNNPLTTLYVTANRDPRMNAAYTAYLNGWKANGGQMFMHWYDIGTYGQYGEWGALESIMQTTTPLSSAPPKWQALQNFISGNPCWWSGCTGTLGTPAKIPAAPTNLVVK
jgi:hypothetical protein